MSPLHRARSTALRILTEPLVHFLSAGFALFWAGSPLSAADERVSDRRNAGTRRASQSQHAPYAPVLRRFSKISPVLLARNSPPNRPCTTRLA